MESKLWAHGAVFHAALIDVQTRMYILEHSYQHGSSSTMRRAASGIDEFCEDNGISRAFLYKLWRAGKGPRRIKVGRKVLMTDEAGADWRREGEEATTREGR
jgi:predicted DNA-binding transcriptional regulator AlpA